MRVRFALAWMKSSQTCSKAFKSQAAFSLFRDYTQRLSHFIPCAIGAYPVKHPACIWVCEREKGSRMMTSEAMSRELQKGMNSGIQELQIVIGGPDGFTAQVLEQMNPALRWSFGPMTLPHEFAAIIAAEQIYRAFTILHHQPYHTGH